MNLTWFWPKGSSNAQMLGRLLKVSLPELGVSNVVAKVDTGAYSGALHATRIKEVKDNKGNTNLSFHPLGVSDPVRVEKFHKRRVKSSNGSRSTRYAIDTKVKVDNHVYPITLTLANRSSMRNPMLIGRNFLRAHKFLIDVSQDNK